MARSPDGCMALQLRVRGPLEARCVTVWHALADNATLHSRVVLQGNGRVRVVQPPCPWRLLPLPGLGRAREYSYPPDASTRRPMT
jgi:hypothetical protein